MRTFFQAIVIATLLLPSLLHAETFTLRNYEHRQTEYLTATILIKAGATND